jgi:hypothetical protein
MQLDAGAHKFTVAGTNIFVSTVFNYLIKPNNNQKHVVFQLIVTMQVSKPVGHVVITS